MLSCAVTLQPHLVKGLMMMIVYGTDDDCLYNKRTSWKFSPHVLIRLFWKLDVSISSLQLAGTMLSLLNSVYHYLLNLLQRCWNVKELPESFYCPCSLRLSEKYSKDWLLVRNYIISILAMTASSDSLIISW